jgi:hypothetical protein
MFVFTLLLCIITKQPLTFNHSNYNLETIAGFAVFISVWCFLLVYISLPFVNLLKPQKLQSHQYEAFFMLGIFILLQLVTLLFGYLESSFTRGVTADWFYYYKGVTNSWIYIISGNCTALIAASLYARYQYNKATTEENSKLSLK